MTKRREPLTYHRALTTIAALIGWDRAAAICGVGERTVRYWSDPDCETEIRLTDAESGVTNCAAASVRIARTLAPLPRSRRISSRHL